MENLCINDGDILNVKNVSLPKAQFVKFQPQSVDFLDIGNPRAVLEFKLRNFSCVTLGDKLCIEHNNKQYRLEVKEVQPLDAASIIEADVNVDFDAPVGYVEPERVPVQPPKPVLPKPQLSKTSQAEEAESPFQAFSGSGRRVDGKTKGSQSPIAPRPAPAPTKSSSDWGAPAGSLSKNSAPPPQRELPQPKKSSATKWSTKVNKLERFQGSGGRLN